MRISRVFGCLLVLWLPMLGACSSSPVSESTDSLLLLLEPQDFKIKGGRQASTRRFQLLFFGFGKKNSFVEAARACQEAADADLLINRLRLRTFEGLMIPAFWISALGAEDAKDIPILGWEVCTVAGTAVDLVAWNTPGDPPRAAEQPSGTRFGRSER